MAPPATEKSGPPPVYRRLHGLRWNGPAGRSALRLADDHLLLCDYRTGFIERYKRFYFRDVEALIIRKTYNWLTALTIWTLIALFLLLMAKLGHWNTYVTLALEGFCALFILRNAIRGPSCRTHIQTAVQTDLLPMLKRTRKTERVFRSLLPLIEEAQGKPEPTPPPANAGQPLQTARPMEVVSPLREQDPVIPLAKLSLLHLVTFILLLFAGLVALLEVKFPSTFSFILLIVFFFLSLICGIIALARQGKHPVHAGAVVVVWLFVIGNVIGAVGVERVYAMVNVFSEARTPGVARFNPPSNGQHMNPFRMRHMTGFDKVLWTYAVSSLVFGLLGLIFTFLPVPAKALPPPLPPDKTE